MPEYDVMKSLGYSEQGIPLSGPAVSKAAAASKPKSGDDFMKSLGYHGGDTPSSATSDEAPGDYTPAGRVGRGLAKSFAGTATGIPRAANAMIGLAAPNLREGLGNLAERVPGVKRAEEFAASPNETWAESAGYWGGEALQFIPAGLEKLALYGAEKLAPKAAAKVAEKTATRIPGELDLASAPAKQATSAPFKPTVTPSGLQPFEVHAARGDLNKLAEIIGRGERAEPAAAAAAEAPRAARGPPGQGGVLDLRGEGPMPGARGSFRLDPITHQPEGLLTRGQRAREAAGRIAGSAAQGAAYGASTDPNDPGAGALGGAAFGATLPAVGAFFETKAGRWITSQITRHGPIVGLEAVAAQFGVPLRWLWTTGLAQMFLWHNAPGGRALGEVGARAASAAGRRLRGASGRIPGVGFGSLENLAEQQGVPYYANTVPDVPEEEPSAPPQS